MATPDIQFQVTPNPAPLSDEERQAILDNPVFGTVFTGHMVDICWSERGGWHRPRVQPYG
ncbi:MAG: branched chain amino acid aminotransferase, partial [Pontimonas sp.]|nr:branched chain amino acid aminotransferase [Pontimonas sp.]